MTIHFSCGQYNCQINGNKRLISLIPERWMNYSQEPASSSQIITIYLDEEELKCEGAECDGCWMVHERKGIPIAIYCNHGEAMFGLQWTEPYAVTVCVRKALESYIRIGIHYAMMLLLYRLCVGIHGVTLMCGGEIIILSAPSGTGKTTLAKLLEKYCDAVVINGDFALLSPTEDSVIFEPTPFCGTSGRSLNHRFRVDRIVFLRQAKDSEWHELRGLEAIKLFLSNAFIPTWDSHMQQSVQENILKCISALKVSAFAFAPTQSAAEMFLKQVEKDSSPSAE